MDITNNNPSRFRSWLFVVLTAVGVSRCLHDLAFYPRRAQWGAWLAPRPHVFIDAHYFLRKQILVETRDGHTLSYDLRSESQWPIRTRLLIFANTLVHCLDRPHLVDPKVWDRMIRFHFCVPPSTDSVLKEEILRNGVMRVRALVGSKDGRLETVQEVSCSD